MVLLLATFVAPTVLTVKTAIPEFRAPLVPKVLRVLREIPEALVPRAMVLLAVLMMLELAL